MKKESLTKLTKILSLGFIVSLFSQVFFGRGLDLDGVHILYEMVFKETFIFYETARIITHFFQQVPAWFFIKFIPIRSVEVLVQVFSFGLIWIHILSILGCYFILPKDKKHLLFFPLFGFFTGPLVALGVSISASLVVCSYIWLVAFMIHYSNLSSRLHSLLLFFISLPLFLSHEVLFYMSWFLIYLVLQKRKNFLTEWLYYYLILLLLICSFLSCLFIFFPTLSELSNRSDFFKSLFYLEFFFKFHEGVLDSIYYPSLTALFFILFSFLFFLKQKQQFIYKLFALLSLGGAFCSVILPFFYLDSFFKFSTEEEVRVFVSCISHPLGILFWWLFEKKKLEINSSFFSICVIVSLSLVVYRVGSDYRFYQFQKQFSASLEASQGIKTWEEVSKTKSFKEKTDPLLFELFNFPWKYQSASLFYPRKNKIKTLVLSTHGFTGCYEAIRHGMCQNDLLLENNKFFNFDNFIEYKN